MNTISSTWTAGEIKRGGFQIKPVTARGFSEDRVTSDDGFAVFNGGGGLVYGPVASETACRQWIERQARQESARLDEMEGRANRRDGIA